MSKITFKDLSEKGKEIIWNSTKNDDDTHKVKMIFNHDSSKEIIFNRVPSQYVKEDAIREKKPKLEEKESSELVDKRMRTIIAQLQQSIFTIAFYGAEIEGFLSSGKEKKTKTPKETKDAKA